MKIKIISAPNQKAFGGNLQSQGATWSNGYSYAGNGGTHESNPNEGIQVGVDPQGIPNLIEEGEVMWNDFVFTNRINVPKKDMKEFGINSKKPISYADAAMKVAEESKERPNDPISKAGLNRMLSMIADSQEIEKQKRAQRQAKNAFNQMSPEDQLGIMQLAQAAQQQSQMPQEQEVPQEQEMPIEENPYGAMGDVNMSAFGGFINKFAKGGHGLKSFKSRTDIETNLPWLKNMYDDAAWEALFDSNDNIIAPKGGNTGLYDPNGPYMKAIDSLSEEGWKKWSDTQKQTFVNNLKAINPTKYQNYSIDNIGKNDWSWENLKALATDGYVGGHHQVAQFANNNNGITGFPNRNQASRYYLRTTGDDGKPKAVLQTDIPNYYDNYDINTGLTWNEMLSNRGLSLVGKQNSSEGNTDYTDYFLEKAKHVPEEKNTNTALNYKKKQTFTRYAPVLGGFVGLMNDLISKPDYSRAEEIKKAGAYTAPLINYKPIGNYLRYNPLDINYQQNKLNQEAAATRRAINNTAGTRGAALASILATDYNAQQQSGDFYRKALEYNDALQQKVEDFNRTTNTFNSTQDLAVQKSNQAAIIDALKSKYTGIVAGNTLMDTIDARRAASMSANISNIFQNLGNIGTENDQRNMTGALYSTGIFGNAPALQATMFGAKQAVKDYIDKNPKATAKEIAEKTGLSIHTVNRYM